MSDQPQYEVIEGEFVPAAPEPDPAAGLEGTDAAEAVHGFRFGDPDGEHARAVRNAEHAAVVSCVNPLCSLRGHHVQLYADTPRPVHCGKCFAVLMDDPDRSDLSLVPGLDMTNVDDVIAETKRQVLEAIRNGEHLNP